MTRARTCYRNLLIGACAAAAISMAPKRGSSCPRTPARPPRAKPRSRSTAAAAQSRHDQEALTRLYTRSTTMMTVAAVFESAKKFIEQKLPPGSKRPAALCSISMNVP